jgi:hypothetical protein
VITHIPKIKYLAASLVLAALLVGLVPVASAMHITPAYRYTTTPVVSGNSNSTATAVTTDASGNTYTAGLFQNSVNFAGSSGSDTRTTTYQAPYISKHGADGSYDWTRTIDTDTGSGSAEIFGVATDSNGNIYAAGYFSGGVVFDGPGGTHSQSVTGGASFINKYSSDGTYQSTQYIIPPANGEATVQGIGFDANNNMYIAGTFQDTVNFGAVANTTDYKTAASGTSDAFVTRVNANGSYGWTRTTASSSNSYVGVSAVTVTPAGTVDTTGYFGGTVNFAGTSGTDNQTDSSGNGSAFVMQDNADGSYGWSRSFTMINGSSYAQPYSIAADPNGNVYVSGNFYGTVNFAGTTGTDNYTGDVNNGSGFLTKYTSNGGYSDTKAFVGVGGDDNALAVTADMNGDIYLLSSFSGTVNFAGTTGTDNYTENNAGALTMYEPDGSYAWTRTFDPASGGSVISPPTGGLTTDKLGHAYVASNYSGTVNFAGSGGNDSLSAPNNDAFLSSYTTFIPGATITSAGASVTANTTSSTAAGKATVPDTGFTVSKPTMMSAMLLILTGLGFVSLAFKLRAD